MSQLTLSTGTTVYYMYPESVVHVDFVVVRYMVEHVAHISRVVGRPGGHLLLVGMGGSGRRSLTRLAAHICGHILASPRISAHDGQGIQLFNLFVGITMILR